MVGIKSKNKNKKNQQAISVESYFRATRQSAFFNEDTLHTVPIIIKISFKGNSSSTGRWGREEQDKEQAIAVTELSITWSHDFRLHPWRMAFLLPAPGPLPAAARSSVELLPPTSSSADNQLWAAAVSMRTPVRFPLLHVRKVLETRQAVIPTKDYLYSCLSGHFIFLTYSPLLQLQFQVSW